MRGISTFFISLFLAGTLWSLDRLTFDDGQVLTVKILQQTDDAYLYQDDKGATNSALKADLKGVEFNVGQDKFLAAALEETDPARQLLFMEKSVKRYPKDRANYIFYTRILLREMKTETAGEILTNRELDNPGFDLLRVWWLLKSKDGETALRALRLLPRKKWNDSQTAQAELLEAFALADSGNWTEASSTLSVAERRQGLSIQGTYTALMAYENFPHFRRSLNSLLYLATTSHRTAAARSSLQPNLTRYWRRMKEMPAGTPLVETMVIHQRPHLATLQDILAITGSAMVGIGVAQGTVMAEQSSDWLAAKTWYENASQPWELTTSGGGDKDRGSDKNKREEDSILAFEKSFTAFRWYQVWSGQMSGLAGTAIGFSTVGLGLGWISVTDPFRWFERTPADRPPMHLKFVVDPRREQVARISSGLASVSLLSAGLSLGIQSSIWNDIARTRRIAYMNNRQLERFDFMFDQARVAQNRADGYRVAAMGSAAAAVISGVLYFWDPFKNLPMASVIVPQFEGDRAGLAWVGIF